MGDGDIGGRNSSCLVLGGSGAIGRFLLPRLNHAGWKTIAVTRQSAGIDADGIRWLTGDLHGEMPDLAAIPIATLFSAGPLDGFAAWLGRAELPELRRVVAVSSMSATVKQSSLDPSERDLAARLRGAEQSVVDWCVQRHVDCVVLRPTLIYGAGVDRSLSALAEFGRRWRVFPSLPGAKGLRQPIHADDVAAACLAAATLDVHEPRIYALGGAERLGFGTMLERLRRNLPVRSLPLRIPLPLASGALRVIRLLPRWRHLRPGLVDRLQMDLVVDNTPAERDLDWSPREFHAGANGGF